MKLVLFNLRSDEAPTLEDWKAAHPEVEIDAYKEELSLDNIHLAQGADAVSLSTVSKVEDAIYEKLHAMGIDIISQRSAGFDMYNLDKLNELGMKLLRVPKYSPNAIGEYVVASALYLSRNLNKIYKRVEDHDFSWELPILSKEMRTLTVGVIGTGNIGRAAAKLFKGLGAQIIGYDVFKSEEAEALLDYVSLDELYERSDIITLHIPAFDDNYHMINEETIGKMKDGVILINAARGTIVDTKAVLKGLDEGKIKGAVLDVYENEFDYVKKDLKGQDLGDEVLDEMIKRDDIIYTPHIAFYTETALENLVHIPLNESIKVIETGESDTIVNK
ncbi:MAG: D-2-hydroxyacid dehydrogenase [Tissierellia bacterium]|nr:D-2-hydroxyacid dehydrogenase [Tissierellia bacterium]